MPPSLPAAFSCPDSVRFCLIRLRQNAQGKDNAEGSKKKRDKLTHIYPQCGQSLYEAKRSAQPGHRRGAPLGWMPTSPGPPQSRPLALWGEEAQRSE